MTVLALAAPLTLGLTLGTVAPASAATTTAHVAWCEQHYRSYNPVTDTFTGYDGRTHACAAPARGATRTFGFAAPLARVPQPSASGHSYSVFPSENDPNYGNPFGG